MGNESAANKRQSSDSAKSIDDSIATAYEQNIGNSAAACASPHQSQSQLSQESQGGVKKRKTVHDVMYQQMDFHPLLVSPPHRNARKFRKRRGRESKKILEMELKQINMEACARCNDFMPKTTPNTTPVNSFLLRSAGRGHGHQAFPAPEEAQAAGYH